MEVASIPPSDEVTSADIVVTTNEATIKNCLIDDASCSSHHGTQPSSESTDLIYETNAEAANILSFLCLNIDSFGSPHLSMLLFCDFLKACTSRTVLQPLILSIVKMMRRNSMPSVFILPLTFNRNQRIRKRAIRGIPNYGQTCFLNSVLQVSAPTQSRLIVSIHSINLKFLFVDQGSW